MLATAAQIGIALCSMTFVNQTPPPLPPAAAPGDLPPEFRAKQILGARIHVRGNVSVGVVDDIVLTDGGQVEYLIVADAGRLVTVPWTAARFNFEQRTAVVDIPVEQYRAIPTYTVTTYPQYFAPTYRTQVYRHYGLTPGELRRIERREFRR